MHPYKKTRQRKAVSRRGWADFSDIVRKPAYFLLENPISKKPLSPLPVSPEFRQALRIFLPFARTRAHCAALSQNEKRAANKRVAHYPRLSPRACGKRRCNCRRSALEIAVQGGFARKNARKFPHIPPRARKFEIIIGRTPPPKDKKIPALKTARRFFCGFPTERAIAACGGRQRTSALLRL